MVKLNEKDALDNIQIKNGVTFFCGLLSGSFVDLGVLADHWVDGMDFRNLKSRNLFLHNFFFHLCFNGFIKEEVVI